MKCQQCGSTAEACGCGAGSAVLTPADRTNRPGLPALSYRVGTHGSFLASMKARLGTVTVPGDGAPLRPLAGLTTRDGSDPAIALLDAWATIGDVLGFYQERIANEGYLRTATERRSVLELANLIGYAARPGVAATVHLAYTLDDNQADPVAIPVGARAQSIPGPDERPQSFETVEPLTARREWNNLQVRTSRPQRITLDTVLGIDLVHVAGGDVQLDAGQLLLFVFGANADQRAVRVVAGTANDFLAKRTAIRLQPVMAGVAALLPPLRLAVARLAVLATPQSGVQRAHDRGQRLVEEALAGIHTAPARWVDAMHSAADVALPPAADAVLQELKAAIDAAADGSGGAPVSDPAVFVEALLKDANPQAANAAHLRRTTAQAFRPGADTAPQLLLDFAPGLKTSYYPAWRGATPAAAPAALQGLYALRASGALFGAASTRQPVYDDGELRPQSQWLEWQYAPDETADNAFLDRAHPEIEPGSYVLLHSVADDDGPRRRVLQVQRAWSGPRSAYGLNGQTTELDFGPDAAWRSVAIGERRRDIGELRRTQFHGHSQPLALVDEPVTDAVEGQDIELQELHDGLKSGRWVIFAGERVDIAGVAGVRVAELLMISGVRQSFDQTLAGDRIHTTLTLATPTAFKYRRDSLVIHGNVVKATHGETRSETLGSGDGSLPLQSFALRQPPLTFVPAPTASGAESTLRIHVNDVEWRETDTFAGLPAGARRFVARTDDAGVTRVTFGNGAQGARLPTGVENVRAVYRNGIGRDGNVRAGQVSLLVSRPLGVKAVLNPLAAGGGADKEGRDLIRDNAPLSIRALDRLVSVADYADFTRGFAGVAKAAAVRLSAGGRELVHITLAGADDMAIAPTSDLQRNLLAALRLHGDPGLAVQVDARELIALVLSARLKIFADHRWEIVVAEVRALLLARFGFGARALAQPALLCEVLAAIQGVRGVDYVDVDVFGGIPEKVTDPQRGRRRLLTQDEIVRAVAHMQQRGGDDDPDFTLDRAVGAGKRREVPAQRVDARPAGLDQGVLHPAQLAIFTPRVPDTLILNQIP